MVGFIDTIGSAVLKNPTLQAGAISEAINVTLGFRPNVVTGNGFAEVQFTPEQEDILVAFLNRQLKSSFSKGLTGGLRIRLKTVAIRVFLANYWHVLAGPFIGGFLTGRRTSKRK